MHGLERAKVVRPTLRTIADKLGVSTAVGHEDVEEASLVNPPLTVTTVSRDEMGSTAAAVLIDRIVDPDAPPRRIVLETELIVRESCGFASGWRP